VLLVSVAVVNYIKKVIIVTVRVIIMPAKIVGAWISRPASRAYKATKAQTRKFTRYGKGKVRQASRTWWVLRKKV